MSQIYWILITIICLYGISFYYSKKVGKSAALLLLTYFSFVLILSMSFTYLNEIIYKVVIAGSIVLCFYYMLVKFSEFVSNIENTINEEYSEKTEFADFILNKLKHLVDTDTKRSTESTIVKERIESSKEMLIQIMKEQGLFLTEQTTSLSQTASTVEQLGVTADQTTEKAMLVVNSADKSIDISKRGHEAFKRSVNSMVSIRKKVERIAVKILELSSQTQKIGTIINTVNELSEFTNLLALNAAIEASKAGEFGKGFSVVASEIRRLSLQSQNAVAEIADIIEEIQSATNSTVMATEEGTKEVDVGVSLINKAGALMEESLQSLEENLNAARQILAANKQQTIGIEQVTYAVTNLNEAMKHISIESDIADRVVTSLNNINKEIERRN